MSSKEALLTNPSGKTQQTGKLAFRHFPGFARFIKDNYLIPYIKEQIRLSREVELPMMRFFEHIPDDELIAMSVPSHSEFLDYAMENKLPEQLEKALKVWVDDQMGIIKREEVAAEDITLAGYIRKKALIKFLPSYTSDIYELLEIVKEIDTFTVESDTAASNVYINLLKDRISEQIFFREKMSNTTPGLQYTFDLDESSIKYANRNYLKFFGHTLQELHDMGASVRKNLVHPDDLSVSARGIEKCSGAADEEIISWEYRLKAENGEYIWMRNYVSVFKRDDYGKALELVGIILDINSEKETANKLTVREEQLLEAQRQTQVGSFELDVETGKMDVTPQFCEIYEQTDFVLNNLIDHVHPDDRARINANRDKAIQDGTLYDNEYRYLINGKEKVIRSRGIVSVKNGRKMLTGTSQDITVYNKMLEDLRASEQRYKQAQELSHAGTWTWNLSNGKIEWTEALYNIYGIAPGAELSFDDIIAYSDPEDVVKIKDRLKNTLQTLQPSETYYRITLKDGTKKILHAKSEAFADQSGKPCKVIGVIQDVTERQQLIERLQQSEELYKQAQAISHIGNWSWDMETKRIDWSDEVYNIYEIAPQSKKNSSLLDKYNHPEDTRLISDTIRHALETNQPFDFNYRIILNNGRIKTINAKGTIDRKAHETFTIHGTLQDITEQKEVEKKIKDYQEFIEKITDVTPSIIAAYNIHSGKYSFINDAIEKLLGYPPSRVMEEGVNFISSIVHPDDIPYIIEKNTTALEEANKLLHNGNEPITEFKYRMRNNNGEYRWFHTYGTIFERNEKGLVESVLNISVDITDQEAAEQELYKKNMQLQQSNTSLEEYAYVASHDLKEPLRKIATFSDRMMTSQYDKLNDEGKIYLNKIIDASRRMQKMIGDLLFVSTLLGNTAFEKCDLASLLEEALIPLEHKIEENNAVIESDDLPAVTVVHAQFRQVFQNLVSNSLKFARKDVPCHIKITHKFLSYKAVERFELAKAKKYLQIQFEDNGIGFENEYANKIFAIFQRLHGKSEYEGTGIGLAICKKIAENHGGIIFAQGVVNQSAVFTIIIPV